MRNSLRLLTLLLAVVSISFISSSCEKTEFDSESIESNVDHATFAELVTYHDDGSFSASLTGDQMTYILENEFNEEQSDDPSKSFAQLLLDQAPGAQKGSIDEKSVTYGAVAIAVGVGGFNSFFQFQGIGGLPSTGATTQSINTCISRSTYPVAFAFAFVFSSTGVGYPVSYNDSSFDKSCSFFSPNWRIKARAAFNTINNLSGEATISCCGFIAAEPLDPKLQ